MKYTDNLVWRAVYEFLPAFKKAKEGGVNFLLPESLKTAGIECFLEIGLNGIASLGTDRGFAASIVQEALKELKENGCLVFGTVDEYWQ